MTGSAADPSSWNKYAYTRGDPVNRVDPGGTDDCPPGVYCMTVWADTPDAFAYLGGGGGAPNPMTLINAFEDPNSPCFGQMGNYSSDCLTWLAGGGGVSPAGPAPFTPVTSVAGNTEARLLLTTFFNSNTFQSCDKVFSQALGSSYSTVGFENEATMANFYIIGGTSNDGSLTEDQVTGNGSSTTLGNLFASEPAGTSAVTLNQAWDAGVQSPAILVTESQMNFAYNNQAVLTHELLHAYLNVLDNALFNDFANYGLKAGPTSNITNWIMTGCKSTPSQ
jgi:hypothetical protein